MQLLVAALATLMMVAACKKPNEPSTPTNPEPKAQAQAQAEQQGPGTTTNFENPPPAEQKPAQ
jgi:uncharacterized lipoprotein YajG